MNCLTVGLIFAVLNLDHIAVGPFLLSRPVVVGSAIGAALGNAPLGFTAGLSVELMLISVPSSGPAAAVDLALAGGLAALWSVDAWASRGAALTLSLLLAMPAGWAAARADRWIRRQNDLMGDWILERLTRGRERILWKALAFWSVLWFVKAWAVFAAAGCGGQVIVDVLLRHLPLPLLERFDRSADLLPIIGFSAVLVHFWNRLTPPRVDRA
jgi:mannose/fructose/N-acetylgalactosamine-specific phosphotransferase system component IIC